MFIKCMTKEEWDNASTEDLLNVIKNEIGNVDSIIWDKKITKVKAVEARLMLVKAALCKLGFPKEIFWSGEGSIENSVEHFINEIAEYEKTSFTIDPKIQRRAKLKLTAPIGDLKAGDEVNLL